MKANTKKYKINKNLAFKLNLCYNTSVVNPIIDDINNNKNPTNKLINNFEEIKSIINLEDLNYIKVLYLIRLKAHKIIYDIEEIIDIINGNEEHLFFYVYLSLLIESNIDIINYTYSTVLIKKLDSIQKKLKYEKIKKVIIAKIIIELISNYENNDNIEEINEEIDLKTIKNENEEVIIDITNKMKVTKDDILSAKIDEMYSGFIRNVIEKKKLEYDITFLEEVDLKHINLTKRMLYTLFKVLDKEKEYLEEYKIKKYDDLFNNKIINFYYTLFRYIIKNDYYIYQIPFLLETRNKIKKLIKENLKQFYNSISNLRNNEKHKIVYYLRFFIEYEYYLNESLKVKKNKNGNELVPNKYYKDCDDDNNSLYDDEMSKENNSDYFSTYKAENDSFRDSINDIENENSGKYLECEIEMNKNDYEYEELKKIYGNDIAFQILSNSSFKFNFYRGHNKNIICNCSQIKINNKISNKTLEEIKEIAPKNNIIKNNFNEWLNNLNLLIKKIKSEYFLNFDFTIIFEFKGGTMKNSIIQIDCKYKLFLNKDLIYFEDDNILEKKNMDGLYYLLNEISSI